MAIIENVIVGVVVGVPATVIGVLGYRRSKQADEAAEESGTIAQIISGLNVLVANYRTDNAELRERMAGLEQCYEERVELKRKVAHLEAELAAERLHP